MRKSQSQRPPSLDSVRRELAVVRDELLASEQELPPRPASPALATVPVTSNRGRVIAIVVTLLLLAGAILLWLAR